MKPTVCRAVHFYHEAPDFYSKPIAATVTAVSESDDMTVSLAVFMPGTTMEWRRDIPFSETPRPGHWTWPPRS